jgi:hypothetical protein
MSLITLPFMFVSDTRGWDSIARARPSVLVLTLFFVVPMSLLPPVMYAYTHLAIPGQLAPLVVPPLTAGELALVGMAFFVIELAMVALMGNYIQQLGEWLHLSISYNDAYTLAAIAPTPLWLSTLALSVPSMWFNFLVLAIAWVGSVALIRHGIPSLLKVHDPDKGRQLANAVTAVGVGAWFALLAVMVMLLGMLVGWR